jgi:hypothetical protein
MAGLFGTAAVTCAACAAGGRLAQTSCEKKKQLRNVEWQGQFEFFRVKLVAAYFQASFYSCLE